MAGSENLSSKWNKIENHDILPEDVIRHIISFLPTDEAIQTSLLSKRWRFLWKTVSNLHIINYHHCKSFGTYVENLLLKLDNTNPICKLSISLWTYNSMVHLPKLLSFAVDRIKNLNLDLKFDTYSDDRTIYYSCVRQPKYRDVPREFFGCKLLESVSLTNVNFEFPKEGLVCFPNLEFLTLDRVFISGIPAPENSPAYFPKLKRLYLSMVTYVDRGDNCVMKLIRNCPVLEDLSIRRFFYHNVSNVDLCIPQLTTANLICSRMLNVELDVEIEAPIKHLKLVLGHTMHNIIVKNPDSLIQAELQFYTDRKYLKSPEQQVDKLLKLFKTFDKVKCLSLADWYSIIKTSNIRLPLLSNLIQLEVVLDGDEFCMMERYLNCVINLQILVIKKRCWRCDVEKNGERKGDSETCIGDDGWVMELSNVPKCLISSLKRIEVIDSVYCSGEFEMIKTMLNCAKALEKLVMKPHRYNRKTIDSLRQKISAFPRASALCQFYFPIFSYRN